MLTIVPPDFWASEYTLEKIGPYPAAAFPTDVVTVPIYTTDRPEVHDVIIIGSGASGGMAAWNLTRHGVNVLMLVGRDSSDSVVGTSA